MQLDHMRAFVVLAEVLNYRRAAALRHLSQPALTEQIRQLERDLGVRLFERDRSGTLLTARGSELLPLVRKTLADVSAVEAAVTEHSAARPRELTVGVMTGGVGPVTWPLLAEFHRRFPQVELRLREVGFANALPAVADRLIDVLAATGPFGEAEGSVTTVGWVPVGAIMAAHLPQALDDAVDLDWVAARAVLRPPPGMGDSFDAFWMMRDREVRRPQERMVPEAQVANFLRMAAKGAVGLWPTSIAPWPGTVVKSLTQPRWAPWQLVARHHPSSEAALLLETASELTVHQQPKSGSQYPVTTKPSGRTLPGIVTP